MHWEARFRELARRQEGLFARHHLRSVGCSHDHWWRAQRSGRWEALSPRVLRLGGVPESDGQRALAAVLDASPGAVLHGASTLAWFGFRGFDLRRVHVARARGVSGKPTHLGVPHELRALRPHHVIVSRGVPTETPLRAIWSTAAGYSPEPLFEIGVERIMRLVDDANKRKLLTFAALHEMVHDIHERGRSGSAIMREVARLRPPGSSPTESRNEQELEKVLDRAGERRLRRQVVVGGHEPIGRTDFGDDELPLVLEVNSLIHHTTPSDRQADELRYRRLNDVGFTVVVIWEDDLWTHPKAVVDVIREGRRLAATDQTVTIHSPGCPWPDQGVAA